MDETPHLRLPYLMAAQAQKHVTLNEALRLLDGIVQLSVLDRDLTAPPASPAEGDRYIPASGATGAWAGWDLNIALWTDGAWMKLVPAPGWLAWIEDEGRLLVWDGSVWSGKTGALLWGEAQSLTAPQKAQAQANIGMVPQSGPLDATAGRLMAVGAFGLGSDGGVDVRYPSNDIDDSASAKIGFYRVDTTTGGTKPRPTGHVLHLRGWSGTGYQLWHSAQYDELYYRGYLNGSWGAFVRVLDRVNTYVDGSGFIKEASPVVRLRVDGIEPNAEAARQDIAFARIAAGVYMLSGSSGLAQAGWRVDVPEDENGNRLVHVSLTEADGVITLQTRVPEWAEGMLVGAAPMDIPAGRFVGIRLDSLPDGDDGADSGASDEGG